MKDTWANPMDYNNKTNENNKDKQKKKKRSVFVFLRLSFSMIFVEENDCAPFCLYSP